MFETKLDIKTEEYIKLIRGQKGNYGWEIKISDSELNPWHVLRLKDLDKQLRKSFIGEQKPEEVKDAIQKGEEGRK